MHLKSVCKLKIRKSEQANERINDISKRHSEANELAVIKIAPNDRISHKSTGPRRASSKNTKSHEVTFSGSVGGGDSDSERTPTTSRSSRLVRQSRSYTVSIGRSLSRPTSPDSNSSSTQYRSLQNSRDHPTRTSSDYETANTEYHHQKLSETERFAASNVQRSSSNGYLKHADTMASDDEDHSHSRDNDDNMYDRDTEEFYSNIQDATGTSGTSRSKRSSLFSRSDSSATTTSSSGGTFTGVKRRSAASIISSSICSDIIPIDRRRSSTATEYSIKSTSSQPRRSSGRVRRHISRMTIAGARRRTTGR
uniref:Uncharacterized protein n=1 Tax=Glossina austeni TaxID=7395 RepID=A0A1A9UU47_GLOAU